MNCGERKETGDERRWGGFDEAWELDEVGCQEDEWVKVRDEGRAHACYGGFARPVGHCSRYLSVLGMARWNCPAEFRVSEDWLQDHV